MTNSVETSLAEFQSMLDVVSNYVSSSEYGSPKSSPTSKRLWALADFHAVGPLIEAALAESREPSFNDESETIPGKPEEHSFLLAGLLLQLMDAFDRAEIPVMPLKGPALSYVLWKDVAVRQFVDLDLLVRRSDVHRATKLLESRGFSLVSTFSQLQLDDQICRNYALTFEHEFGQVVDLNYELSTENPYWFDVNLLWESPEEVEVARHRLLSPKPEVLLLYLCSHGAKHAWSRLQWVCDVGRLVVVRADLDWNEVLRISDESDNRSTLLVGLELTRRLLRIPLPESVMDLIQSSPEVTAIVGRLEARFMRSELKPPSSFELARFHSTMARGVWAKCKPFLLLLKAPTEAEGALIRLPKALFFLYYPIRIWRLTGKYVRQVLGQN